MSKNKSIQVSTDFLKLLEGKCSLFFHEGSKQTEPLADMITSLGFFSSLPVICLHWGKAPEHMARNLHADFLLLPISRNFTSTLIGLGKLLADKQHIILIQNFDDMASSVDRKPFLKFLEALLNKCIEKRSTLLATSGTRLKDLGYEANINGIFNNIFRVNISNIQKVGLDGQPKNCYNLYGEELATTQVVDVDMEKIREIFRLTPEEQNELDAIANKQIRDLNIT
ncbi:hypothetical protein [Methanolobus sp.]|uniref:hypothetical protein n=1 Tax=Methanolobus sp. TaxID=1874737 RepID=UPI0025F87D0C|nr:hypothetical protein [Methanolobus sp.]